MTGEFLGEFQKHKKMCYLFVGLGVTIFEKPIIMEWEEQEIPSKRIAEPKALLHAYLDSGRCESRFGILVDRLSGLVMSSALRRTGDHTLAEEVAQNVFAILARKAESLRSHPNLSAWVFRTTQLESAKAMRSEMRHQRKLNAFASEPLNTIADEASAWSEALPELDASIDQLAEKDRELVIQRFFERKRFAEIAGSIGKSEAACKVQLKRALEKLAILLRSRGVALSVPVIATGLTAEFAKAAPIASQALAAKALAASSEVSISTLITNTLLTMSTGKSSALAVAAVIAISLVPILQLEGKATQIQSDIANLERPPMLAPLSHTSSQRGSSARNASKGPTFRDLLESSNRPVAADSFLSDLMKVSMEQDIAGMIRVLTPVANMDSVQHSQLVKDIEAYPSSSEAKALALQMLGNFAPDTDYRKNLETMIRQDLKSDAWSDLARRWAEADPEVVLAWFREMNESGALLGKGVDSKTAPDLLSELAAGMASKQPEKALAILTGMPPEERSSTRIASKLISAFTAGYLDTGESRFLDQLIANEQRDQQKQRLVDTASELIAVERGLEAARNFLNRFVSEGDNAALNARMVSFLSTADQIPFTLRADWIVSHLDPQPAAQTIRHIIGEQLDMGDDPEDWIRAQPAGMVKDLALATRSEFLTFTKGHKFGLDEADQIGDPTLREKTRRDIAASWLRAFPDAARRELPAELLPQDER